jgi:hypothetical protein
VIVIENGKARSHRLVPEAEYALQQLVRDLEPDERKAALALVKQISHGNTELFDVINAVQYDRKLVSMEQFIDDEYYLGLACKTLYPKLREDLIEFDVTGPYTEVLLGGAIGYGKSTLASILMAWTLYKMSCLRDPQSTFGMSSGSEIHLVALSKNLHLARRVMLSAIMEKIKISPYFNSEFKFKEGADEVKFDKGIVLQIGSVGSERVMGLNVFACLSGNHFVWTDDGPVPISSMEHSPKRVWTRDDLGAVYLTEPVYSAKTGRDFIFEVTLSDGQTLEANASHRWLVVDSNGVESWVRTDQLKADDSIVSFRESYDRSEPRMSDLWTQAQILDTTPYSRSSDDICGIQDRLSWEGPLSCEPDKGGKWRRESQMSDLREGNDIYKPEASCASRDERGGVCQTVSWGEPEDRQRGVCLLVKSSNPGIQASKGSKIHRVAQAWDRKNKSEDGIRRGIQGEEGRKSFSDESNRVSFTRSGLGQLQIKTRSDVSNTLVSVRDSMAIRAETVDKVCLERWCKEKLLARLPGEWSSFGDSSNPEAGRCVSLEASCERCSLGFGPRCERLGREKDSKPPEISREERSGENVKYGVLDGIHRNKASYSENSRVVSVRCQAGTVDIFDVINVPDTHRFYTGVDPTKRPVCCHNSVMDEINFLGGGRKQVIKTDIGQKATEANFDKAENMYAKLDRRIKSRFLRGGMVPAINILLSSKTTKNSFLERRIAQARFDPNIFVREYANWEVKQNKFSTGTFKVLVGSMTARSRILNEGETFDAKTLAELNSLVIDVPNEYKVDFERDLNSAIRDIAGVSTDAISSFIARQEKIYDTIKPELSHPFTVEEWVFGTPGEFVWGKMCESSIRKLKGGFQEVIWRPKRNPDAPRHVHIDVAVSGDSLGLAMGHSPGWVQVERRKDGETYQDSGQLVEIDCMLRVNPPPGEQIYLPDIRRLVYELIEHGYQISGFSCDQFQSTEMLQQMSARGVRSYLLSVDRTNDPYEKLKSAIYEDRLSMYAYKPFIDEILALEYDRNRGKVDHLPHLSKDVTDAVAGVIEGLSRMSAKIPIGFSMGVSSSKEITSEDDGSWVLGTNSVMVTKDNRADLEAKAGPKKNNGGNGGVPPLPFLSG